MAIFYYTHSLTVKYDCYHTHIYSIAFGYLPQRMGASHFNICVRFGVFLCHYLSQLCIHWTYFQSEKPSSECIRVRCKGSMCVYTHILIYSYTHILIYSYAHMLTYSYTHILICSYLLIYSYAHILIYVCMCACGCTGNAHSSIVTANSYISSECNINNVGVSRHSDHSWSGELSHLEFRVEWLG